MMNMVTMPHGVLSTTGIKARKWNPKSHQQLHGISQNGSALLGVAITILVLIITPKCTPTWMIFSG
jgi:hypothetical protein